MAHITSIGSGLFSNLAIHFGASATADTTLPASPDAYSSWDDKFTTASDTVGATNYKLINNIRDFPQIGTPPNIVNVPVYGQKVSQQIQAQSDAPNIELTINYVPDQWKAGSLLGDAIQDGIIHTFRFTLLNTDPLSATASVGANVYTVPNTQWFWLGKIEALLVAPSLSDANTAIITLSLQSDIYGAFTTA